MYWCKTQNSGLRSKEEKPRDPINQSSRCNTQEGLLSVAQTGWLWSPGRQSQQIGQAFYRQKNHTISILHTGYKVIGYMFAKQSYWYKLHRLLFKLRRPRAFQLSCGLFTGCIMIGWLQVTRWGRGIPPFHGKPKAKSRPTARPSASSAT